MQQKCFKTFTKNGHKLIIDCFFIIYFDENNRVYSDGVLKYYIQHECLKIDNFRESKRSNLLN